MNRRVINNLPPIGTLERFIQNRGGNCNQFYVGIAKDPESRLKDGHGVYNDDEFIYIDVENNAAARMIEKYFLDRGCDGGPSGGDEQTKTVYIYLKNPDTDP